MRKILAIDIGGSTTKHGVFHIVDGEPVMKNKGKFTTATDPEKLIHDVMVTVEKYREVVEEIEGIAISICGVVNHDLKRVIHAGSIYYLRDVSLTNLLHQHTQLPISVENDAKAGALGEWHRGSLRGCDPAALITLGSALGCGIIANGELLYGKHYSAGEISFMQKNINGNFLNNAAARNLAVKNLPRSYIYRKNVTNISVKQFFRLLNNGDQVAKEVLTEYCERLAYLIINISMVLDPERIAIGGGVSSQSILIQEIQRAVELLRERYQKVIGFPIAIPEVVASDLGNDANLYGAVYRFLEIH